MNFIELTKKRYSCRSYAEKKVEQEKLDLILEAGRVAPTGKNLQPQRVLVIQQEEGLAKIAKAANLYKAPLAIIICADLDDVWVRPFDNKHIAEVDTSIVTDHMMLQATELGLDSVWICYFKPDVIKAEFNLPPNFEPINILAIGYGNDQPKSPSRHDEARKPLDKTVFFEHF